jgi:hypothetical protein
MNKKNTFFHINKGESRRNGKNENNSKIKEQFKKMNIKNHK